MEFWEAVFFGFFAFDTVVAIGVVAKAMIKKTAQKRKNQFKEMMKELEMEKKLEKL